MTELNFRLRDNLEHLFYRGNSDNSDYRLGNWGYNSVLNRMMCCNLGRDIVEIPLIMKSHIDKIVYNNRRLPFSSLENKTVVAPILNDPYISDRRTADSIIRYLFERGLRNGMGHIRTNKGLEYYGGQGYILDGDYNVLMFTTLSGRFLGESEIAGFIYTGGTVYINPSVLNSTDIISKALLKKVIPFMLNNTFRMRTPSLIHQSNTFKVRVVIEDKNDFFMMPQAFPTESIDESINIMLNDNIEGVISQLY